MTTRKKGNKYTRKKQIGGGGGGDIQLNEKQIQQLVDTVDKHTVDLNIPEIYKGEILSSGDKTENRRDETSLKVAEIIRAAGKISRAG